MKNILNILYLNLTKAIINVSFTRDKSFLNVNTGEAAMSTENDFEWDEFDQREFEADFEMAVDMFEFALKEEDKNLPNTDSDNLLERFKKSDYESAKRLRGI